ncbi:MAG: ECF-type sigma factor [Thermoanaerobaculia bacterium]
MEPETRGSALTRLIDVWRETPGGGVPVDALWQAAYDELKVIAKARLRSQGPVTVLDTTDLVNESYLKLAALGRLRVESRGRFFAYAARVMRSVVVDLVRESLAARRGGDATRVTLDTAVASETPGGWGDDPLGVDAALAELERVEPRLARVVEMRYFSGYSEIEIGELLGLTERTVRRDWQKARLLLRAMLRR